MVNDSKPGAKMFEEALKIMQLQPEEVCHVGDHPENDVEAAMNLGMKAVWLNLLDAEWPKSKRQAETFTVLSNQTANTKFSSIRFGNIIFKNLE